MKKFFLIFAVIIGLLLGAAFAVPIIFKDDIQKAIDSQIANSLDADVFYDTDHLSISLFSNFPNLSVGMSHFGVVGHKPFAGDTLVAIKNFEITVDLMALIKGNIKINSITLDNPLIQAIVLPDGTANWDIAKADTNAPKPEMPETAEPAQFDIAIQKWELINAQIYMRDLSSDMFLAVYNLSHTGGGNFTQDVVDLRTNTTIDELTLKMGGVNYLKKNKLTARLNLKLDMPKAVYAFDKNNITLNDLTFNFDGQVAIPENKPMVTDITFNTPETDFKSLLSLVPAVYLVEYKDLKADGAFALNGSLKGALDTENDKYPAFELTLNVDKGKMKYPDLPKSVEDIFIDLKVHNPGGTLQNTEVHLNRLSLRLGQNPVDIMALTKGLHPVELDVNANIKINLADLSAALPITGTELAGLFSLNAKAKGTYDTTTQSLPAVTANLGLANGLVKTSQFPEPVNLINLNATINNPNGKVSATSVDLQNLSFAIDGQPFAISGHFDNPESLNYNMAAKGTIDLGKITKMFPLEGMALSGVIDADVATSGNMALIEAEAYDKLPTSGTIKVANLKYETTDLPPTFIKTATAIFNPQYINLSNFEGTLGNSDLRLSGQLSNYLAYALKENETLHGEMNFESDFFDVDEWMEEETTETEQNTPTDSTTGEGLAIPRNIDFALQAAIAQVKYDNMDIKNLQGVVTLKDGVVGFTNCGMQTLGGNLGLNGTFDTRQPTKPAYDFDIDIIKVSIAETYNTFNTVQAFAPVAKNMAGQLNTDFKLKGDLGADLMPIMGSISGAGLLNIIEAALKGSGLLNGLNSFAGTSMPTQTQVNNLLVKAEIKDGRAFFEPFDINLGGQKMTIGGSNGLDGTMDYVVNTDLPTKGLTGALSSAVSGLAGLSGSDKVNVTLGVTGPYGKPKFKIINTSLTGGAKNAVDNQKAALKAEAEKRKKEAEQKARQELDKRKKEAEQKAKEAAEKAKKEAEEKAKKELQKWKKKLF